MFLFRLSFAAALLAVASLCAARTPVYRLFGDWLVACDNGGHCHARSLSEMDAGLFLRLDLEPGGEGAQALSLEASTPLQLADLRLDGERLKLVADGWQQHSDAQGGTTLVSHDPAAIQRFFDAVRNGQSLTLEDDPEAAGASLAGLSAALLLIDETQGRLGSGSALLRRGSQAARQTPKAAPLPLLPPAAPAPAALDEATGQALIQRARSVHAATLQAEDCFVEAEGAFDQAVALTATDALVFIECWRGAYQSSSLLFRLPRQGSGAGSQVVLELPFALQQNQPRRIDAFTNADYDPAEGLLSHWAKGRGLADCGESASWVFDGDRFHLQQYGSLDTCRGGDPGDWPTLWRTRPAPAR